MFTHQCIRIARRYMATAAIETPRVAEPNTYFKITSRRSCIGLGERTKGTMVALGIHRRMQTVYHKHTPDIAGKILAVKELVEVENVPASAVRTKPEQTRERRSSRGFTKVASWIAPEAMPAQSKQA